MHCYLCSSVTNKAKCEGAGFWGKQRLRMDHAMVISSYAYVVYYASLGFGTEPRFSVCFLHDEHLSSVSARTRSSSALVAAFVHLRACACADGILLLATTSMDVDCIHRIC